MKKSYALMGMLVCVSFLFSGADALAFGRPVHRWWDGYQTGLNIGRAQQTAPVVAEEDLPYFLREDNPYWDWIRHERELNQNPPVAVEEPAPVDTIEIVDYVPAEELPAQAEIQQPLPELPPEAPPIEVVETLPPEAPPVEVVETLPPGVEIENPPEPFPPEEPVVVVCQIEPPEWTQPEVIVCPVEPVEPWAVPETPVETPVAETPTETPAEETPVDVVLEPTPVDPPSEEIPVDVVLEPIPVDPVIEIVCNLPPDGKDHYVPEEPQIIDDGGVAIPEEPQIIDDGGVVFVTPEEPQIIDDGGVAFPVDPIPYGDDVISYEIPQPLYPVSGVDTSFWGSWWGDAYWAGYWAGYQNALAGVTPTYGWGSSTGDLGWSDWLRRHHELNPYPPIVIDDPIPVENPTDFIEIVDYAPVENPTDFIEVIDYVPADNTDVAIWNPEPLPPIEETPWWDSPGCYDCYDPENGGGIAGLPPIDDPWWDDAIQVVDESPADPAPSEEPATEVVVIEDPAPVDPIPPMEEYPGQFCGGPPLAWDYQY